MSDKSLFCIIKEFNQTQNKSGKIWQIKLLSGTLAVGDKISLFCVDFPKQKCAFNKVDAVIKHIKQDISTDIHDELFETAKQGDIVTINLKECRINGKRIDKSDVISKNLSIGLDQNEICDGINRIKIRFINYNDFIEKLSISYEKGRECLVSLLWFGKRVPITLERIELTNRSSANDVFVYFNLYNNRELPIPRNDSLRNLIRRVVIKDHYCTEDRGRGKQGIPRWRYYVGEILFDD